MFKIFLIAILLASCATIEPVTLTQGNKINLVYPIYTKTLDRKTIDKSEYLITLETFVDLKKDFRYVIDLEKWGVREYWASPIETETNGIDGDCEDFASLIRDKLAKLGVDSRLVLVKDFKGNHVIVLTKEGWVVDNRLVGLASLKQLSYEIIATSGYIGDNSWYVAK